MEPNPPPSDSEAPLDSPLLLLPNTYRAFYGGFAHLRPFQRQAILPILEGRDLVLQAATGSGKTEAVLAPCMERVLKSGRRDSVVYLVPTRALAMDLERRLAPVVVQRLGLSLGLRTGDAKRMGGGRPDLMLTTPESLDVLLGSSNRDRQQFTARIRTVVVDEVHPLLRQVRGRQLAHVLRRLECRIGRPVQKIAVSATIADVDAILFFFGFSPNAVCLLDGVQRSIVPHLVHLKRDEEFLALLDDLHRAHGYQKILLFANSRGQCDRLFGLVRDQGSFRGVSELHYSNLKARERRAVEGRFRRHPKALCIATSTLELGIDVGDVDGVVLYEPPDSVTAFLQRIGRSNRRANHTHFWGICRGERAGEQLLRFLGLLDLAREGRVETPLPNEFPSVLIQQTLSCLYQQKSLSLGAMQALFPHDSDELRLLFPAMERQGWLRPDRATASMRAACSGKEISNAGCGGLFRGGWRYGRDLLDLRIWSNFPESEEDFTLEVSGDAVADLPRSIVRQLEPGDRVHLAGRPIQVLEIVDRGERKRVLARPADRVDDKKILWLGTGCQVPFEVAQAMREVLSPAGDDRGKAEKGLFRRTRLLLEEERSRRKHKVTLANGMEVWRDAGGFYRYETWLGSMGNLVLRLSVEAEFGTLEDFSARSDEMGLTCSKWIDFQSVPLPLDRDGFQHWVKENLQTLRFLLPLNAFAHSLPPDLLLREVTGFVFDERVAAQFSLYRSLPSTIASGDPKNLLLPQQQSDTAPVFLQPSACAPLLAREQEKWLQRWAVPADEVPADARQVSGTLTGTLLGDYVRHRQCARFLSRLFLSPELRCRIGDSRDDELEAVRMQRGNVFEELVTASLSKTGASVISLRDRDDRGNLLPMEVRSDEALRSLQNLLAELDSRRSFYLLQPVLRVPALLKEHFQPDVFALGRQDSDRRASEMEFPLLDRIHGTGIPDWIRLSGRPERPLLEVGDIKGSSGSRDRHKWQVAFYAHLLKARLRSQHPFGTVKVSHTGHLITRNGFRIRDAVLHSFDLLPFLTAMPALFHNVAETLLQPPSRAPWQLRESCTTCPCFDGCYGEALRKETVHFIPGLSRGVFSKLRRLGLTNLEDAETWLQASRNVPGKEPAPLMERPVDGFEPQERERLAARLNALRSNGVTLRRRRTRCVPSNLSTAIFVHLTRDPILHLPRAVGFLAVGESGQTIAEKVWTVETEKDLPIVWQSFEKAVFELWRSSVTGGKGPHFFHTGKTVRQGLEEWATYLGESDLPRHLWQTDCPHWTDLMDLLREHFVFPIPARWTLKTVGSVLGFVPDAGSHRQDGTGERPSLFHPDPVSRAPRDAWQVPEDPRQEAVEHLEGLLHLQAKIWQWARVHLASDREECDWLESPQSGPTAAGDHVRFLEEERRLRQEDVLSLQEHSLEERVDRFRALGPLTYEGTALDEEGRFLYNFRMPHSHSLSKFREDDFLKLTPVGVADLQSGHAVVLARLDPGEARLSLRSRQGALNLNQRLAYSLEEDLTDWNHDKLVWAVNTVLGDSPEHPAGALIAGRGKQEAAKEERLWVKKVMDEWEPLSTLNHCQRQALELPFCRSPALIEGPPGTGKTHLLSWILIALMLRARERGKPLRIAISALTHRAIDGVLRKVRELVLRHGLREFPGRLFKMGRWKSELFEGTPGDEEGAEGSPGVEELRDWDEASHLPHVILGATVFGIHSLFKGRSDASTRVFDWIIFDEASQIQVPQALLGLAHGRGRAIFLGDVKQLPPIVLGNHPSGEFKKPLPLSGLEEGRVLPADSSEGVEASILSQLMIRYGREHRVRLLETYRMNADICAFPSTMWYDGELFPASGNARSRLLLNPLPQSVDGARKGEWTPSPSLESGNGRWGGIVEGEESPRCRESVMTFADRRGLTHGEALLESVLDPDKPVVLVLMDHEGCRQKSDQEVEVVALLAGRLMTVHGVGPERLGLISPHRAHNNAVAQRMRELLGAETCLPVVDTVERLQGSERDVVFFSLTTSDPDHTLSPFLNNPNRFNVAITRARTKLVVVGSRAFFFQVPETEEALKANACFKEFLQFCRERASVFIWNGEMERGGFSFDRQRLQCRAASRNE